MSQYPIIIFSSLVFFISLFFFKAIFPALLVTCAFALLAILFEKFWRFKETPIFLTLIRSLRNIIISVILALSIFFLIYFPLEFQITEIWFLMLKFTPLIWTIFLIFLVFVFNLINWQKLIKLKFSWILMLGILILVAISTFVYRDFRQQKLAREYLPKIYKVSPDWGVQGQIVKIEGVNFGPSFRKGKVVVGTQEMVINFWDEKLVIIEQSVPAKFRRDELKIIRSDGVVSNGVSFEVRDPDSLKNSII